MSTTLKLTLAEIDALKGGLEERGYEMRPLQHAHFQARGEDVVVSAYKSGKVVVQGKGERAFLEARGLAAPPAAELDAPVVGSDESGKGDYFGPLVVAAVAAGPDQADALAQAGVRDSKKMSDPSALRAAAAIRTICVHSVRALSPEQYNARHEAEGNVALFLARMHGEATAETLKGAPESVRVVIDQFTSPERLEKALRAEGVDLPLEIRHRAEDNLAVAAASVLARAEFLIGLKELGHAHGLQLPKGAGANVDRVARRIFRDGGMGALASVAKIHFKTTTKVTERLF
ncbi:MAG: ribonuclease HIII [Planctomycetota bacterium]|nr:ribonuclease HIII [Planctomycetota bacterium]